MKTKVSSSRAGGCEVKQQPGGERDRGARRLKLFLPAQIEVDGVASRAHLLNVSLSGALVHSSQAPAPRTGLSIICAGLARAALVQWADKQRFGVTFMVALNDLELHKVLSAGGAKAAAS